MYPPVTTNALTSSSLTSNAFTTGQLSTEGQSESAGAALLVNIAAALTLLFVI